MCNDDLVYDWESFNDILTDCSESQSDYDISMRELIEKELERRGAIFERDAEFHVFKGFTYKNLDPIVVQTEEFNLEENLLSIKEMI